MLALCVSGAAEEINLEGRYPGHLQDVWSDGKGTLWWTQTHHILKTDMSGKILAEAEVEGHNAGCEVFGGVLYVAICPDLRGPQEGAFLQVNEYDADSLKLLRKHSLRDVRDRAGSLCRLPDGTFLVGCLRPDDILKSQVRFHRLDRDFKLISSHIVDDLPMVRFGIEVIKRRGNDVFLFMYEGPTVCLDAKTLKEKARYRSVGGAMGMVFDAKCVWKGVSARDGKTKMFSSKLERLDAADFASAVYDGEFENVALGKKYTLNVKPSYPLCNDPGDAVQLTDGKRHRRGSGQLWTRKGTVGWQVGGIGERIVTVDLGSVTPICGFGWESAAGMANVGWPEFIFIYVSDDGRNWYFVGDLYERSKKETGIPREKGYEVFLASSKKMPARGRYVAFLARSSNYMFVDEVEVYRGGEESCPKNRSGAAAYPDPLSHLKAYLDAKVFVRDAAAVARGALRLPEAERGRLLSGVGRLNALVLRGLGFPAPFFWEADRWASASPTDLPESAEAAASPVAVTMMRGETRSAAVNLSNPGTDPLRLEVGAEGFPKGANVELREVVCTMTKSGERVGSLLSGDGSRSLPLVVPPGETRQIWVSFAKPSCAAGRYEGRLVAGNAGKKLVLDLAPVDFPARPRLHVGGWDYTDNIHFYKNPASVDARIERMREMFVDTPWGGRPVMPSGARFDSEGRIVNAKDLDFGTWKRWIARWGETARQYCVFMGCEDSFHGEKMGTERFNRMVGGYMRAWYDGIRADLAGRRIIVLLVDEPSGPKMDEKITIWAKAVKAGAPEFVIFEDPDYRDITKATPALFEVSDIICPGATSVTAYKCGDFYKKLARSGKELWLYSCCGPSRTYDPIVYYRAQAWLAWKLGAKATQFWAFGCGGGIGDSFRPMEQTSVEYSPFFVSPAGAFRAKQSEAIMESVEDYEYLAMLAGRIAELKKRGRDVAELERFLAEAPERALPREEWLAHNEFNFFKGHQRFDWLGGNHDHRTMDAVRIEILKKLVETRR